MQNTIVLGLGYGDEGKGTIVDYLCSVSQPKYVVRFSGGPQTAHNVVTKDGRHHTFAQFGSGTFHGVRTLLSRFMLVNPLNMAVEADHLLSLTGVDPFSLTFMSEKALLITPLHVAANQAREIARGNNAHGSCGQGIGETMDFATKFPLDALRLEDLANPRILQWKMTAYYEYICQELGDLGIEDSEDYIDYISDSYYALMADRPLNIISEEEVLERLREGSNVFEGSQGVLLDEWKGFHPHTTWSTTTAQNAQTLLAEAGLERGHVIGVTRTYGTRHGYGPFPAEFSSSKWHSRYLEKHNGMGRFQGAWRTGLLDLPLLDYALKAESGVDEIALTHCDIFVDRVISAYPTLTTDLVPTENQDLDHQEEITSALNVVKGQGTITLLSKYDDNFESWKEPQDYTPQLAQMITKRIGKPVRVLSYGPTDEDKQIHENNSEI